MKKALLGAIWGLLAPISAFAAGPGERTTAVGDYFVGAPMLPAVVRPANTTAYAANQVICASTCTPLVANLGPVAAFGTNAQSTARSIGVRAVLQKSGPSTTNASFTIWFYGRDPVTPSGDQAAYPGPYAADLYRFLGSALCATPAVTADSPAQVYYECSFSNPNSAGAMILFQKVQAYISTNAAYTPASGETFSVYLTGLY